MRPNVFNYPPSLPFIETLANQLIAGELVNNTDNLIDTTVYLPHNRACIALKNKLIEKGVVFLPRILPLGDTDNDWDLLDPNPLTYLGLEAIKPVLSNEERVIALAPLIESWHNKISETPISLFESLGLADKLCQILDQLTTEQVSWDKLKNIDIDSKYDDYWRHSKAFLEIITEHFPQYLEKLGHNDKASHRNQLLEAERLRVLNSPHPVIAAGSTGSILATRRLLKTIAEHPQGAVILPGLDIWSDDETFKAIGRLEDEDGDHGHPQFGLKRLIEFIGVERGEGGVNSLKGETREALLYNALRPANTTHLWKSQSFNESFFQEIVLIEAQSERQEALAIAIAAKDILQDKAQSIAIITPERGLGRKIISYCESLGLDCDDTAGLPMNECQAMLGLRLHLQCATNQPNPLDLLSLSQGQKALNIVLRGLIPSGWQDIKTRILRHEAKGNLHKAENRISENDKLEALNWLEALQEKLNPLISLKSSTLQEWLLKLLPLIDKSRDDGEKLFEALENLSGKTQSITCDKSELDAVLMRLLAKQTLRKPYKADARLRLYGLPEARLNEATTVILAGLNENSFPQTPETDAWLNRKMKYDMGVEPPERRIGLAAHDFAQSFGAQNLVLTRSLKQKNNPTIPSRWLQRLEAVLTDETMQNMQENGQKYIEISILSEEAPKQIGVERPAPKPPQSARPLGLSVTEIEKLIRDPYAIYAKHILHLHPQDEFNQSPSNREYGTLVHDIFQNYEKLREKSKIDELLQVILELATQAFAPFKGDIIVDNLWLPRFTKLAKAFVEWDESQRSGTTQIFFEEMGEIKLKLNSNREFTLRTRADRLQVTHKSVDIYDYKTGTPPTNKQIINFKSPQLPLTGVILNEGGFDKLPAGGFTQNMAHIALKKSNETLVIEQVKDENSELVSETKEKLLELLNTFEQATFPYTSHVNPMKTNFAGDYDLLSRLKEWQQSTDFEEEFADE